MKYIEQYLYYAIIGVVSFVSLVFLPFIGTEAGLSMSIPNTWIGWVIWIMTKTIVAVINILIFHCFMQQAKVNVKDNENYKQARKILIEQKDKETVPRSPVKWNSEQYIKKGTSIFITSILSTFALTQAVLSFDYVSMLTYLFTIIMGLIFGIIQMKSAEDYWTREYLEYALKKEGESRNDNIQREKT